MSTSKRKIILGSVGAITVTLLLAASSWSMSHGARGHDPERMLEYMSYRLDLSDQQQAEIGALLTSANEQRRADKDRLKALHSTLKEQRKGYDEPSLQAAADEIGEITSRRVFTRTSTQARVYSLLDADQQAKMDEMMSKRKMRKKHRRAHRGMF